MLFFIVKLLRSLVLNNIQQYFDKYIFKSAARAMAFGIILTIMVQSSSITTSTIVPLAGAGVVRLHQLYPFTIGANVGTTVTALLASLTLNVTAMVAVTVTNHNQERISLFAEIIKEIPEVIECYRMSGETDYLLKVVVKDIESYDNFYKNLIEKVQFLKVTSNFAIEEIKSTTEIPLTAMEKIA